MFQQMSPGLVSHHVALLWRCVTFGVRRDDVAGRQGLARREPFALGVIQAASVSGWLPHWKSPVSSGIFQPCFTGG